MNKILKYLSLSFFALALVFTLGVGNANAALTLGALTAASDGALTITGAVSSVMNFATTTTTGGINLGTANTTGGITIGNAAATSGITAISGGMSAANTLFDAVTSGTISIGAANTGGISIGNGNTVKAINIGAGNAINTIHIGDNATPVNVITIGGIASSLALTDANWAITSPGAATFLTVNGNTITNGSGILTLAAGKTLTANNTITLAGTDSTTMTFPGTSATIARIDAGQTFTGVNTMTSPVFITPDLGTPSAAVLTYATGLPVSTGISGLGTGVAAFLAVPSSANLITATTDETGSGALVFANTPTLVTPVLGVATGTSLALGGGTALATTNQTGTGNLVLDNTPTLITPALGAATATSVAVGGGKVINKIDVLNTGSITPVATAATIGVNEQTFTVAGLAVGDNVFVTGPTPTALCPNTGARVSATDTLQLDFTTLTAAACTPAAGTYNIVVIR